MRRRSRLLLAVIVAGALAADVAGLDWGLPYQWHTDEKVTQAINVLHSPKWDPDYYINPHLHIYVVAAAFKAAYLIHPGADVARSLGQIVPMVDHDSNARRLQFLAMRLARGVSVACDIAAVLLLFAIGRRHWDEDTGLLAAVFGAVTMGLVNLSHFATPESLLILLMLLALRSFDAIITHQRARDYLASGVWIGLACATKYTACVLAVPFIAAHAVNGRLFDSKRIARLLIALGALVGAFIAGMPLVFADWRQFWTFGVEYNWYTGAPTGTLVNIRHSFGPYFQLLGNGLGWPLFALGTAGLLIGLVRFVRGDRPSPSGRGMQIHGVWIVSFFGLYGLSPHHALRFIMPIAPSLVLLAAYASMVIVRSAGSRTGRRLGIAGIAAVLVYSALYTGRADYMVEHDTRYAAGEWLNQTIPDPAIHVDYFSLEAYLPYFVHPRFELRFVPFVEHVTLHQTAFWSTASAYLRDTDGIIVDSNFYYDRYLDNPRGFPERAQFYRHLLAGTDPSGFRPIARFTIDNPRWLNPRPERIAPDVVVFAKAKP